MEGQMANWALRDLTCLPEPHADRMGKPLRELGGLCFKEKPGTRSTKRKRCRP